MLNELKHPFSYMKAVLLSLAFSCAIPVIITDVGKDDITLYLNHPLAGKKLDFSVEVVGLR